MLSAQFAAPLPTADIDQPGGFSSIPSLTCSEPPLLLAGADGEKISLERKIMKPNRSSSALAICYFRAITNNPGVK